LEGQESEVTSLALSGDGDILASAICEKRNVGGVCAENKIVLWDIHKGQPVGQPFVAHINEIMDLSFSLDNKTLASAGCLEDFGGDTGCVEGEIILWNVATGMPISQPLITKQGQITHLAFSPDGKTLASSSIDGNTTILWNMIDNQPIEHDLSENTEYTPPVSALAFSTDSRTLISSTDDGGIILWDVASRQAIGHYLTGDQEEVTSLNFSADGETFAAGSWDGSIILGNLNPDLWVEQTCQRVGRNFTRGEWDFYFLNEEYRTTCPQWPLEPEITATPSPTP